ncbi:hypothetical protein [Geobacter sp. SVR]|uniref:hypothetical protein n=1 Tax=Geobacter sp. SVR TaxID=2495594 RepID=UPI00143EFC97|nr:hypothetical protein [Geobacter sp. SVR]BCS54060.1 hypothetical protein GSVR_23680 [Geobacter sp. SVR]GCF87543.1 hypothetical protein GSbR_41430 [Geobacter sp. SVR]
MRFLIILLILVLPLSCFASERCKNLAQEVRTAHYQYFGIDYPYWYSVGQLEQESSCRNVISRDGVGSEGPAQVTYRVWAPALQKQGITEVKTTKNNLRAQAYINKVAHNENPHKKLWITYQIYNGGGLVLKEINKAGEVDWAAAYAKCSRKVVHFKDGSTEKACDINYYYSKHVFKFGETYRTGSDSATYSFW